MHDNTAGQPECAVALSTLLADGILDGSEAQAAAGMILAGNARELYRPE